MDGGGPQKSSSYSFPFFLGCSYHIFLSFRHEDTGKTFTDHLYTALVKAGFHTFRDDHKIKRDENIEYSRLNQIIQKSNSSVIIFSKDFAFSRWCLDELEMILKCKRNFGHRILPVYYDVEPTDVRKQLGRIGEAFSMYEEKFKYEIDEERKREWRDKVKGWRDALKEVAGLAGLVLPNVNNGHESEAIKKIVKVMEDKVSRVVLKGPPPLVGIHSRAKTVDLWLQHS
ncbi:hypothetical protein LguiA_026861 [Lonicera macranthoides]